ncbi:MAG TPA: S8 family serine peptidase [Chloroflexia bacterium]|nr:S8 family serine peptidase [Chloroflexia bacterium]
MKLIRSALKFDQTRPSRLTSFGRFLLAFLLVLTLVASLDSRAEAAGDIFSTLNSTLYQPGSFKPGEVIVKFRQPAGGLRVSNANLHPEALLTDALAQPYGLTRYEPLFEMPGYYHYFASSNADMARLVAALGANPAVEYAEPNYRVHLAKTANDPFSNPVSGSTDPATVRQWYLKKIGIESLWDLNTGINQVIAVLDSGINPNHEDLCGAGVDRCDKYFPAQSYSTIKDTSNYLDVVDHDGHGTAVASIIAAQTNNGIGMSGINWNAQILPVKVIDESTGEGDITTLSKGIYYATDHQARIINISLGSTEASRTVENSVKYAQSKGVLIVTAAGNTGIGNIPDTKPLIPVQYNYSNVISVAATDENDKVANFSNPSPSVKIAAPGVDIFTAYCNWLYPTSNIGCPNPDEGLYPIGQGCNNSDITSCYNNNNTSLYAYLNGTSFSAPIVTGIASLMIAANQYLTNEQIINIIETTADDIDGPGFDQRSGFGRINAANIAAALTGQNWSSVLQGLVTGVNPADVVVNLDPTNEVQLLDSNGGFHYNNLSNKTYNLRVSVPKRGIVLGPVTVYPNGQHGNVISVNFDVPSGGIVCGPGAVCPGAQSPAPGANPAPPPPPPSDLSPNAAFFARANPIGGQRFFSETGHNLGGSFRAYWETHGGLPIFGLPISEEFQEVSQTDGKTYIVQYFERNRFEFHPENNDANKVLLGLLGSELTRDRNFPPGAPIANTDTTQYFPETQHTLTDRFLAYWKANGGLAIFGYPISEPIQEGPYLVQYFERNRFEFHPENAGTKYEVLLGLLGNDLARSRKYIR